MTSEFELRFAGWLHRYGAEQVARVALEAWVKSVTSDWPRLTKEEALANFDEMLKERDDDD